MNEDRLFWLAIFGILVIFTLLLLVEHSRGAIILVGAIIFCGLLYRYSKKMEGKNAKFRKRA
jgi:4-hydroxybenzoate polyprenyltransferase